MNVFLVLAHPEPRSFNAALTRTAVETLERAGHTTDVSDLYAMRFDPVSDRRNFTTVKDAAYYKQQAEEQHATQHELERWSAHVAKFGSIPPIEYPKLSEFDPSTWAARTPLHGPR
jgi:putative NADPH-quinone reductase